VSLVWAASPVVVFIVLAVRHESLLRVLERRRRAARFYQRGLARLDGRWPGTGEPGGRYLDPAHPYARDLDLFGKGSLFELLSTARTHSARTLWRTGCSSPPLRYRARAPRGRRGTAPALDLREELAILAEDARSGVDPMALAAWGEAPPCWPWGCRKPARGL